MEESSSCYPYPTVNNCNNKREEGEWKLIDPSFKSNGLADHKDSLGAPLCPCRHYDDKAAEVSQGFWNCPCVPMRERVSKSKSRISFVQEGMPLHALPNSRENDFAGTYQLLYCLYLGITDFISSGFTLPVTKGQGSFHILSTS
ncbi:hypothetical protein SAY86_004540 [Trapa natans]|uniref:Ferredoxin-thioredoxin reductase catalytic chain, chloroplastic n=1 Tax=Trapa natans TaxID=22666 RepID=A0AAN7RQH4_TRANT|nr:hypothetical protein SAY86_004540 [Trapa natans]